MQINFGMYEVYTLRIVTRNMRDTVVAKPVKLVVQLLDLKWLRCERKTVCGVDKKSVLSFMTPQLREGENGGQ